MKTNRIRRIKQRLFFDKSKVKLVMSFTICFDIMMAILAIFKAESVEHYFQAMTVVLAISIVSFYLILWAEAKDRFDGELKSIRRFRNRNYAFLYENGFKLKRDLSVFDGNYKGYDFRVAIVQYPIDKKKWGDRSIISTYYKSDEVVVTRDFEEKLSGEYNLGFLAFMHHMVSLDPRDTLCPDFESNFNRFIEMLEREKLAPLSFRIWIEEHEPELTQDLSGD